MRRRTILAAGLTAAFLFFQALPCDAQEIEMEIVPVDGGRDIDFGSMDSVVPDRGQTIYSKEVQLRIVNRSGRRFVLSQYFQSPPISDEGRIYEPSLITCRVQLRGGDGEIRAPFSEPVETGEREIFLSGEDEITELLIVYEIRVPAFQDAGRYNASIAYKVSTL